VWLNQSLGGFLEPVRWRNAPEDGRGRKGQRIVCLCPPRAQLAGVPECKPLYSVASAELVSVLLHSSQLWAHFQVKSDKNGSKGKIYEELSLCANCSGCLFNQCSLLFLDFSFSFFFFGFLRQDLTM
jgi:hypothetical protein